MIDGRIARMGSPFRARNVHLGAWPVAGAIAAGDEFSGGAAQ
jgi:hypothetical protein